MRQQDKLTARCVMQKMHLSIYLSSGRRATCGRQSAPDTHYDNCIQLCMTCTRISKDLAILTSW